MNADGSGLHAVVEGGGTNTYPSWSPDGSTLLFTSTRTGQPNLYRVDLATGDITPVTALNVAHQGAYSPDGSKIVYVGDEGVWRLYVLDVGTNEAQALDEAVYAQRPA